MTQTTAQDRDEQIRGIAYELWERAGRPAGRSLEHWLQAEAMWQSGQAAAGATRPAPEVQTRPAATPLPPTKRRGPYKPF